MAYRNKILTNPFTGVDIRFLHTAKDTNGQFLEMEATYHIASKEPPVHYHPYQSEYFTVLKGEITVRLGSEIIILKKGEAFSIPPNEPHSMWNGSAAKAVVNWKVMPAMDTEHFLETTTGLINDGKIKLKGGNILQLSLTATKFSAVFRLLKPPYFVQKILFGILTPVAWCAGYSAVYKKYLD